MLIADELRADPPSDRPTPPVDTSLLRSVSGAPSRATADPTTSRGARSCIGMPTTTEKGHHLVRGGDAIMGDETQLLKRNRKESAETDGAKPHSVQETFLQFAEYPPLATTGHNAARAGSAAAPSRLAVPTAAPVHPTLSLVDAALDEFRQNHQVVGEAIEESLDEKEEDALFHTINQLEADAHQEVENGTSFIDLLGAELMHLDGDTSKRMTEEAFPQADQLQEVQCQEEKNEERTKRIRCQQENEK